MSKAGTIQIKVGTVEVTFEGAVERDQLEDVLRAIRQELPELVRADASASAPTAAEILARADARTYGEKAGVVAYWLEQHGGRRDWRSGDIVDAMRDAGETPPANITDALNQKLKKGLFEVQDRRWRLTDDGRGWVRYRLLGLADDDDDAS